MRGPGWWLDPVSGQEYLVDRHELWVLANAEAVGVPGDVTARIRTLHPQRDEDEIRMAGINVGLVRIRDYFNRISVQFGAIAEREPEVLQAVFEFLSGVSKDKFADLWIDNLLTGTSQRIPLNMLGRQVELAR